MSTADAAVVAPRRSAAPDPTSPTTPVRPAPPAVRDDRPPAAQRGRLDLDRSVVEKIAGQAASEVAAAGASSGGLFGLGARPDLSARPKVDAELDGTRASLAFDLAVAYPTSIRQTATRVREHVSRQVLALTGVQVTRVDITITATHRPGAGDHHQEDGR